MKIGIFSDAYYPQISGVVTSIVTLREQLIKNGHEVYIITVSTPMSELDSEKEENVVRIPSIPFRKWKELRIGRPFSFTLEKKIRDLDLDIIHTQTEFSVGMLGRRIAKSLKIPIIHTYHTMYVDYTHYVYSLNVGSELVKNMVRNLTKTFINKCDAAIAPTKKTQDALVSYGVTSPVYILPTGIDIKHFEHYASDSPEIIAVKEKYGIPDDVNVLLYLGRVSEEKSIDVIVKALPNIVKEEPNTILLIVGDGPNMNDVKALVKEKGLEDKVIFTGMVPYTDVPYFYSIGDVFVNASKTETQGLTIMEAMASSLPIVVFNDTNIAEHIKNGISGRLFDTEEEFIEMTLSAIRDKEENAKLISNGMEVINSLSKENFCIRILDIYAKVIEDFEADK